jgi:CubicO group peptidase (beta-lactamase class C family)/fluoride ion exporter CrcB/FEX
MKRKIALAVLCLGLFIAAVGCGARSLHSAPIIGLGQVPASPVLQQPKQTPLASPSEPVPGAAVAHALTSDDVEAFIGGILPMQLKEDDIGGATVSVVKDGKVLFAKGYGYADVKNKKPVSADETLFRCGSISKLFTWTSVMQLQEQGKVDLDHDINDYLDFKIPYTFQKPITLRNLMTHTPGFEEGIKDLILEHSGEPDLGSYLKNHLPAEIFPPGTTPAYSNYGAALAGYIVQRVSGIPLDEYINRNIFQPLGMIHSSFKQPLPAELLPLMSGGYGIASEDAKPFEVVTAWPAGSLSISAGDIARFMIAHLQNGRYGDATILRPETAELMHTRQFGLDPGLNGIACGFYEESLNGHRIIGHGGDTVWFHSDLHLVLDSGLGFFVSYNSAGRGASSPREELWQAFLDRYFPYTQPDLPVVASAKGDSASVSGSYLVSRRGGANFTKTLALLTELKVVATDNGEIETPGVTGANGQPKRWCEIGPLRYRDDDGQGEIVFKPQPGGATQVALSVPILAFESVPWYSDARLLIPAILGSLIIMLLTLILWPIGALVRRHYGRKLELSPGGRKLRLGVMLVCALDLIFLITFAVLLSYASEHLWILSDGLDPWLRVLQVIGWIGALGTLIVFVNAVRSWFSAKRRIWYKLYASVLVVACIAIVWFELLAHLLKPNMRY